MANQVDDPPNEPGDWNMIPEPDPAPASASVPAGVLSQAEIDSLIGPAAIAGSGGEGGLERIVGSGLVSSERLPMLEIVFDRLVRHLSSSLRTFANSNVEVEIAEIQSLRFGAYLDSLPSSSILAVFKAEEWDNHGLVVADSALIYSVVDVLLGGRHGSAIMRLEGRPYTVIERTLIEKLVGVILNELQASFEPLTPVTFTFDRLEVNSRFAAITRLSNAAVLVKMRIDMDDHGGRLELLLPYATLEPVRELLLQQFMGERFGRDRIWESHLADELCETDMTLDVVLDEQVLPLSAVMNLQVGSRIVLSSAPGAPVTVRCGPVSLFQARVGRRQNHVAVCIESDLKRVPA